MAETTDIKGVGEKEALFPYLRWTAIQRWEHILMIVSVFILLYTGLPLMFSNASWAQTLVNSVGGMDNRGLLHRIGAVIMIGTGVFHVLYHIVLEQKLSPGRIWEHPMMIRGKDFSDFFQHLKYNLHLTSEFPKMGRYWWFAKLHYFSLLWGFTIMILSGLPLWFKDQFVNILPPRFMSVLPILHGDEAVLALLFTFTLHMYDVHYQFEVFPMRLTFLHGHTTMHRMRKWHPLELESIKEKIAKGEQLPSKSSLLEPLNPIQRILDSLNSLYPLGALVFLVGVYLSIYFIRLVGHF
ncbi:MAG: hypothetical protein ACE5HY_04155 [Candidatus Hydrothermarchaeales archaeon]